MYMHLLCRNSTKHSQWTFFSNSGNNVVIISFSCQSDEKKEWQRGKNSDAINSIRIKLIKQKKEKKIVFFTFHMNRKPTEFSVIIFRDRSQLFDGIYTVYYTGDFTTYKCCNG